MDKTHHIHDYAGVISKNLMADHHIFLIELATHGTLAHIGAYWHIVGRTKIYTGDINQNYSHNRGDRFMVFLAIYGGRSFIRDLTHLDPCLGMVN